MAKKIKGKHKGKHTTYFIADALEPKESPLQAWLKSHPGKNLALKRPQKDWVEEFKKSQEKSQLFEMMKALNDYNAYQAFKQQEALMLQGLQPSQADNLGLQQAKKWQLPPPLKPVPVFKPMYQPLGYIITQHPIGKGKSKVEAGVGIEPTSSAHGAEILPLDHPAIMAIAAKWTIYR